MNDRSFLVLRVRTNLLLFGCGLLGCLLGFLCALGTATGELLVGTGHTDGLEHAVLLLLLGDGTGLKVNLSVYALLKLVNDVKEKKWNGKRKGMVLVDFMFI